MKAAARAFVNRPGPRCACGRSISATSRTGTCKSCGRKRASLASGLDLRTPKQRREVYAPSAEEEARIARQLEALAARRRRAYLATGVGGLTDAEIWANAAVRPDGPEHAAFGRPWGTGHGNAARATVSLGRPGGVR